MSREWDIQMYFPILLNKNVHMKSDSWVKAALLRVREHIDGVGGKENRVVKLPSLKSEECF